MANLVEELSLRTSEYSAELEDRDAVIATHEQQLADVSQQVRRPSSHTHPELRRLRANGLRAGAFQPQRWRLCDERIWTQNVGTARWRGACFGDKGVRRLHHHMSW